MVEAQIKNFSTVSTSTIPSEVSEVIFATAIERGKEIAGLRQYGFVDNSPNAGAETYIWSVFDALTDAAVVPEGAAPSYDDANATKSSATFKKIMKAFKITWEAGALTKINMIAGQTRAATDMVRQKEDYYIATELISSAGNTTAAAAVWSGTSADPVADIRKIKRMIRTDGYEADTAIIAPTDMENLISVLASNQWYGITEQVVKTGELSGFMGMIWVQSDQQTAGTVTVFKSGIMGAFITAVAKDISINMFDDKDAQITKVQVYERVVPCAVVRADAVGTITSVA